MSDNEIKSPEGRALVKLVMAELGIEDKPRELARRLGWTGDDERKLYRYHSGQNAPNFEATIALLSIAGFLDQRFVTKSAEFRAAVLAEAAVGRGRAAAAASTRAAHRASPQQRKAN